ncbi:phage head closure protein [Paradesulfitobacterium aromaticivorans]
MDPGKLKHQVTIQQNNPSQDAEGVMVENWVDIATVWAAVQPLQGRELLAAQSIAAEVTTRIRIRFRAGITSAMRILYGSRVFDIQAPIDPEEKHQELNLLCREVMIGGHGA